MDFKKTGASVEENLSRKNKSVVDDDFWRFDNSDVGLDEIVKNNSKNFTPCNSEILTDDTW
jgi:hypothetical protein